MTIGANALPVIIDTDPGLDDAVAILLALQSSVFEVKALTTVAGNIGLDVTTRNAGRLANIAGYAGLSYAAGANGPIAGNGIHEEAIHGSDGLGGVSLPEPAQPPYEDGAVALMCEVLNAHEAGTVDILALAPLTNIAHLIERHPDVARRIGRVIIMGGAIIEHGNVGAHSEFNFAADPEAADIVFKAGLNITLIPLDVTRKIRADKAYVDGLSTASSAASQLSAALIKAYFGQNSDRESRPLHDPCVMLYAMQPDVFTTEQMLIAVDLNEGPEKGQLLCTDTGVEIAVAMKVDAQAVLELLAQGLK